MIGNGIEHVDARNSDQAAILADLAEDLAAAGIERTSKAGVTDRIHRMRAGTRNRLLACLDRLRRLGIEESVISASLARANAHGSWVVHELVSAGQLSSEAYFRLLASDLGVAFSTSIEVRRIVREASRMDFRIGRGVQVCCREKDGSLAIYTAPDTISESVVAETIERFPSRRKAFRIVQPDVIQAALEKLQRVEAAETASSRLFLQTPHMSAKFILVSWQAFLLGVFVACVATAAFLRPWETLAAFHGLATLTFAIAIATRLAALYGLINKKRSAIPEFRPGAGVPVYSVLVALHREASVASQILKAMAALEWPQSRLEVI